MAYYICGYSKKNIIISKPLVKTKTLTNFDNRIFENKIFSNSQFDLSIKLYKGSPFKIFIAYCIDREILYNYLIELKNKKQDNNPKVNILNSFDLCYKELNFSYDKIYYSLKREYPYHILIYRCLTEKLPNELVVIILKFLQQEIIVSLKINKSRNKDNYYICLPNILY